MKKSYRNKLILWMFIAPMIAGVLIYPIWQSILISLIPSGIILFCYFIARFLNWLVIRQVIKFEESLPKDKTFTQQFMDKW